MRRRASRLTIWPRRKTAAWPPIRCASRGASSRSRRWRGIAPEEHLPGARFTSDADLLREGGNIATTIFHPGGHGAHGRGR